MHNYDSDIIYMLNASVHVIALGLSKTDAREFHLFGLAIDLLSHWALGDATLILNQ